MILTTIFYDVDNFCKDFSDYLDKNAITDDSLIQLRKEKSSMPLCDIMTILIYFHRSGYRTFKKYYIDCHELKGAFKCMLSYNRFVELERQALAPLTLFMKLSGKDKCTGISYIDSTKLQVCHNLRIYGNRVFAGIAKRGKTSTGWFYGFKLHLVINEFGEIIAFALTTGNVADNNNSLVKKLVKACFGKLIGDRGYISKTLFKDLFEDGIKLITRLKKKMQNKLMDVEDKFLLSKRGVIESVNALLKEACQIEHSRHRSPINFFVNLVAGLAAYSFLPKKPTIHGRAKAKRLGAF
jgi:hypothetical protein